MNPNARDRMSTDLVTIAWDETVASAHRKMQAAVVRHLPVRDDTGQIMGVLSDRDVRRAMISTLEPLSPKSTIPAESIRFDPSALVRDYMSWPVETVTEETPVRAVAERMIREKFSSLLVTRAGQAIGILTTEDLLRVLVELLDDPGQACKWDTSWLLAQTGGAPYAHRSFD